jgi:NCAIR mutase (PurE)-related protein
MIWPEPHYFQATCQFLNKVSDCPVVCSATSVTMYGTKFGGPSVRNRLLCASSVGMPSGG